MKDEIKEIYLSNLEWTKTHNNIGGVMGNIVFKDNISYEEYNKLFKSVYFILCDKDYITNLQNENMKYDQCLTELTDNYKDLQKELTNLQEENETLKELNVCVGCNNNPDYKLRIKKAIEYIHNHQPVFELSNKEQIQKWFEKEYYIELLNILNGGDDND